MKPFTLYLGLDIMERIKAIKNRTGIPVAEFIRRAIVTALESSERAV